MVRKAKVSDIERIHELLEYHSKKSDVLPRALGELYDNVRDFFVYVDGSGEIKGTCALHVVWEDLAEVRSLTVQDEMQGKGVGAILVDACLREAKELGIKRVFALTSRPEFFEKLGFKLVDKSVLPHKIWADCIKCVKFPYCDEVALILDLC